MAFIKVKEDFVCENCKTEVKGNGYTNHCPVCLYSKHVDVDPGDRLSKCGGLMKPMGLPHNNFRDISSEVRVKRSQKNSAYPEDLVNFFDKAGAEIKKKEPKDYYETSPIKYQTKNGETSVIQECLKCGHKKKNKLSPEDKIINI
ncbi:MAG: RNHCP domain-containing protein [Candidatus Pacebacteria bacterium]|nr:RNHCP domain-containing protein [Candidatus Paceibacterota bacterium]